MHLLKGKKSRWIALGFVTVFLLAVSTFTWYKNLGKPVTYVNSNQGSLSVGQNVELILQKSYICGADEEQTLKKNVASSDQLLQEYHDWQLVSHQENKYIFRTKIQDLAPICKEKGYFGLSGQNILTLFEGPPEENKVIQTFFQIDTKKFESSLPNELGFLNKGIRIKDLAEYNSILSTYEEYAEWSNGNIHPTGPKE
ncbi:MAG TPA: BofC C-terminal domain-containing protein [Bacillota bacterium]|nr:BofC C-terminal domain-containing protein [Bacillota bacterium]